MREAAKAGWDMDSLSLGETKWRVDWGNSLHND